MLDDGADGSGVPKAGTKKPPPGRSGDGFLSLTHAHNAPERTEPMMRGHGKWDVNGIALYPRRDAGVRESWRRGGVQRKAAEALSRGSISDLAENGL